MSALFVVEVGVVWGWGLLNDELLSSGDIRVEFNGGFIVIGGPFNRGRFVDGVFFSGGGVGVVLNEGRIFNLWDVALSGCLVVVKVN